MDSFEWNKILGAVLGTLLFIVALNILVDEFMKPERPQVAGIPVAAVGTPTGGPAAEVKPDWGSVLPTADLAAGEKVHQRCLQCHVFEKGGPNKIGPNLYGVVGAKRAHEASYSYSSAMQSMGGSWGYDELDAYLANPRGVVPGTKMTFAGVSKQQDRIDLIAWMRTKADSPLAIPAPKPAAAEAPAAGGGPDGESPTTQTQTSPAGATPPAPAPAPTGGVPPASPVPAPAQPAPATPPSTAPGATPPPAAPPPPTTPPATPPATTPPAH
jgi:cytochrome c